MCGELSSLGSSHLHSPVSHICFSCFSLHISSLSSFIWKFLTLWPLPTKIFQRVSPKTFTLFTTRGQGIQANTKVLSNKKTVFRLLRCPLIVLCDNVFLSSSPALSLPSSLDTAPNHVSLLSFSLELLNISTFVSLFLWLSRPGQFSGISATCSRAGVPPQCECVCLLCG